MQKEQSVHAFKNVLSNTQIGVIAAFLDLLPAKENMKHGEKILLDEGMSVVFIEAAGSSENENILEAHRRFFDLHHTLSGNDTVVWKRMEECTNITSPYNEDADYLLVNEQPSGELLIEPGAFCLIAPGYAHMALYGNCGHVKKVVFKIPVTA